MIEVPPTMFGPWLFNRDNLTLWLPSDQFEVDLERCLEPAEALDWLVQVQGKTWATPAMVGHLVEGLTGLLYGYGSPTSIPPDKASEVILENERVVLTHRRFEERMAETNEGPLAVVSAGEIVRLETECRAEVDSEFAAAEQAEISEHLLPSGLSVGDVYAIGLANRDCPVGRVDRGYGADEVVVYLFDWITGTFRAPMRITAKDIREVRHAVLLTTSPGKRALVSIWG